MKNSSSNNTINTNVCPLCQQQNLCAVEADNGCWCMKKNVPTELIKKVPNAQQGKTCICQSCINKYNNTTQDYS